MQRLIRSIYNVGLIALLLAGSPWWLCRWLTKPHFREGLRERFLGLSKRAAAGLPQTGRVWIHAVSVGEVIAVSGLVGELRRRLPGESVVVSTTTRTGQAVARERFGGHCCFYFPLDFPWAVQGTMDLLQPRMLVLAESELWPNVLTTAASRDVPVVMVNARISDRSLPRYLRLRVVWRPFLRLLTRVMAQTPLDAERLRRIGVPEEKVEVAGNLKFDVRSTRDAALTVLLKRHLAPAMRVLVCGSTLEGEEELLLEIWEALCNSVPDLLMILAPRHPERFNTVAALLDARRMRWIKRSVWGNDPRMLGPGEILLLDSIGELASLYSLASVAFVGGSLVAAGGHNPLEPAQFGVPVVMGPHGENFRAIIDVLAGEGGLMVTRPDQLQTVLADLLTDTQKAQSAGLNAKRVFDEQAGATGRCADAIVEILGEERH